jgi:tRNA A-37 threonylcarbamoyl transferase component Bud32
LDEFELFAVNPNTQESFFIGLRALHDDHEHAIVIVTSSRITLQELGRHRDTCLPRDYFSMFLPLNLGLFSSAEANLLIKEPSRRAGIEFADSTVGFILDVAGPHPFFLQVACDCVFDHLCVKSELAASDLDDLRQEIGGQLKGMFRYYWNTLDQEQKAALVKLENGRIDSGCRRDLEELARHGLVVKSGRAYDYLSASFREFVRIHQSTPVVQLGEVRVLEEIDSGATGVVYKAYQSSLKRYVAVKVLSQDAKDESFLERFHQEAQALASLRHPNIVSVHGSGQGFGPDEERAYIVMDYVSGGTLADRIAADLSLERAMEIAIQVGDALHYAHQQGIVHRDVKPTNILIDENGEPLLTDFGLVRMLAKPKPLTEPGVGVGTAAYMAPEQVEGMEVDARSDVYALGTVLYEMVTGHLPFVAEDGVAVVLRKLQDPPIPPTHFKPSLPDGVEEVILKSIARSPENRYQSASELSEALRSLWAVGS